VAVTGAGIEALVFGEIALSEVSTLGLVVLQAEIKKTENIATKNADDFFIHFLGC
jgi:hypothetical protein